MAKEKIDDKAVLPYLKSKRAALDQAIGALEGKAVTHPKLLVVAVPVRRYNPTALSE